MSEKTSLNEGQPSFESPQKKIHVNKLVLLGDVFVGKTSISLRFVKDEFSDLQESTVGAVFLPHALELSDAIIKFDIWDTAGQERFRSLAPMYYKGSKAAVVVYDITVYETFKSAKEWIKELHENTNPDTVIALVGNKVDLEENRQVSTHEAKEFCERNGLFHFEVSAKKNINVQEVFLTIAKKIPLLNHPQNNEAKTLTEKKDAPSNRRCLRTFSFSTLAHKFGFIGLGNMGSPMVKNLSKLSSPIFAYDLAPPQAMPANIQILKSLEEIPADLSIIITMLPNAKIVKSVCYDHLIPKLKQDNPEKIPIIIDSSTISPFDAREIHQKAKENNILYVDAPVSGGVTGAGNGTLTFMVGNKEKEVMEKIEPVLKAMGKNIFVCGEIGTGQIAKMCNNMALAIQMLSICEALSLGNSMGISLSTLSAIMSVSTSRCWSLDTYNPVPNIIPTVPSSRNYEGGFSSSLMLKDLSIAFEACQKMNLDAKMATEALEVYKKVVEEGLGGKDFSVVYDVLEKKRGKE